MKIAPCSALKKEKIFLEKDQKWKHRIAALLSILDSFTIPDQVEFFVNHQDQIFISMQKWWSLIKAKISKNRTKFFSKYETPGGLGLLTIKEGIEWSNYMSFIAKCIWIYKGSFSSLEHEQFLLNWIKSLLFVSCETIHTRFQCEALQLLLLWIEYIPSSRNDHPARQLLINWIQSLFNFLQITHKQETNTIFSGSQTKMLIIQKSIQDLLYLVTYGCFLSIESIITIISDLTIHFIIPFELKYNSENLDIHNIIAGYFALWISRSSYSKALYPDLINTCIWISQCSLCDHQSKSILLFSDLNHPIHFQLFESRPLNETLFNSLVQLINELLHNDLFDYMILNRLDPHNNMFGILLYMIYDYHVMNNTISSLQVILDHLSKISRHIISLLPDTMQQLESIFEFLLLVVHGHNDNIDLIWLILMNIGSSLSHDIENDILYLLVIKYYSKVLFTIYVINNQYIIDRTMIIHHPVFIQEWTRACESLTRSVFNIGNRAEYQHQDDYLHDAHYIWEYSASNSINSWKRLVTIIDNIDKNTELIVGCYESITKLLFNIVDHTTLNFMFTCIWLKIFPLISKMNIKDTVKIVCEMIKEWIERFDPTKYMDDKALFISFFYGKLLVALKCSNNAHIMKLFSFLFEIAYPGVELCIYLLIDSIDENNLSLCMNMISLSFLFKDMEIPCFSLTDDSLPSFVTTSITYSYLLNRMWAKIKSLSKDNRYFLFYWIIQIIISGEEYKNLVKDALERIFLMLLGCTDPLSYNSEDEYRARCALQIYSILGLLDNASIYKDMMLEHLLKALRIYYNMIDPHQSPFKKIHRQQQYQVVCLKLIHQILWIIQECGFDGEIVMKELKNCYRNTLELYDYLWGKLIKKNKSKQTWIACLSSDSIYEGSIPSFGSSFDDLVNSKRNENENIERQLEQLSLQVIYQCTSIPPNSQNSEEINHDSDADLCFALYSGHDKIMTFEQLSNDRILITVRYPSGKFMLMSNRNSDENADQKLKDILTELITKLGLSYDHLKSTYSSLSGSIPLEFMSSLSEHIEYSTARTGFLTISEGLKRDLNSLDKKSIKEHIKAAIIFKGKYNNEKDILTNNTSSDAYRKFLDLLSIQYEDRKEGYRYYENSNICITFHDSIQIARSFSIDDRYLKRKQYVGNDHIYIVFIEQDDSFTWDLNTIRGDFGTMIILVKPLRDGIYSIRIIYKESKMNSMIPWNNNSTILIHEGTIGYFIRPLIVISYRLILESISLMPYRHPHYDRMIHINEMIKKYSQPQISFQNDTMRNSFYESLNSIIDLGKAM